MNCPLERTATKDDPIERSNRYTPKNADEALCYQLHDTLKLMLAMSAHENNRGLFDKQLALLELHCRTHRQMHPL